MRRSRSASDPDAAPGRISPAAPLALTLVADLPSLAVLQPWAGTTAVIDGRLHADLTARGTLRDAPVSGSVAGTNLTVDAPQYGLYFRNGRVSARIANRRVTFDDLAFTAGGGEFRATGTLAAPTNAADASAAHVAWHAEKFRVFNRPDFNLVVTGDGEIALANGKLTLTGSLRADEGRFVYQFDPLATLGDDVVVKGWDRRPPDAMRAADVPLAIDVNLDFGDRLTFVGRGLDTGLRGEVRVTQRPRRLHRPGPAPHGERHVLRVRSEARHRSRSSHLRRPARQPRARHRRAAPQSAGRGGCRRHGHGPRADHHAHVESAGAGQREALVARPRAKLEQRLRHRPRGAAGGLRGAARTEQPAGDGVDRAVDRARRHLAQERHSGDARARTPRHPPRRARWSRSASG